MYRLLFQGLIILALIAIVLGFVGVIPYSGLSLIGLLALILLSTYVADRIFSFLFRTARNYESSWITGLILFFILAPIAFTSDVWVTLLAGVIASASKYIFAIHRRHLFNPAACAVVVLSLAGTGSAIWWVGSPVLLAPVLILGLLIVRKVRRFDLFLSFIVVQMILAVGYGAVHGTSVITTLTQNWLSWPVVFFASIMLTEPFTTPPTRKLRIAYGVITAFFFTLPLHIGSVFMSPALALIIGNIFSYFVSSKQRFMLTLKSKEKLSSSVYEFVFTPDQKARFTPGQYMEWTLPHTKIDPRGNRRYFTIASAPEDDEVRLGMRISDNGSSFKKALEVMQEGGRLSAAAISGNFILPNDRSEKVLCVAGGIGITPFVSMMRSMIKRGERRDMILLYVCNTEAEFAYQDVIDAAASLGVQAIFIAGKPITQQLVMDEVRDHKERTWYLSGPQGMVQAYKNLALSMGVSRGHIKTDYFPGL